jgi:ABC-type molybdate transport system substrate-binding protein
MLRVTQFSHLLTAALIGVALLVPVSAQSITVGFIERPPSIFQTAGGDIRGNWGRKLEVVLIDAGIYAEFSATLPENIDSYVENAELDALIITNALLEKGQPDYIFADEPLFYLTFYAYHLTQTPSLNSFNDLTNASVVVPISPEKIEGPLHTLINTPVNNIEVIAIETQFEQLIRYVREGKADYGISYFNPDNVAMLFSQRTNRRSIVASELFRMPLYFVLRTRVENADAIMQRVNASMAKNQ